MTQKLFFPILLPRACKALSRQQGGHPGRDGRQRAAGPSAAAQMFGELSGKLLSAAVSYTGKASFQGTEKYVRDFRQRTHGATDGLFIEISAVNGKFTLDFLQPYRSPLYVNAFLKELAENGICCDLQDVNTLVVPDVRLPWRVA